jgi:hypothetical protein
MVLSTYDFHDKAIKTLNSRLPMNMKSACPRNSGFQISLPDGTFLSLQSLNRFLWRVFTNSSLKFTSILVT